MPARLHHVLLALGLALLLAAVVIGVLEVRRHGMTCGVPFGSVQRWRYADAETFHACEAAVADRRAVTAALGTTGVALMVGAGPVRLRRRRASAH